MQSTIDKELEELILFVTRNKVKNIEVIGQANANSSMTQKFYYKLSEGAFKSDREAAQYFFGTDEKNRNYKELKRRLKKRLINTSLFIDTNQEGVTPFYKFMYSAQKELTAAKLLQLKGRRINAISTAHRLLKRAQKYAIMDIVADCSRILFQHYGTIIDIDNMQKYIRLWQQANHALLIEAKAFEYMSIIINLNLEHRPTPETNKLLYEKANSYYQELQEHQNEPMTYRFQLFFRHIHFLTYWSIKNYEKCYDIVEESILHFKRNMPWSVQFIRIFSLFKADVCLILQKYEAGIKAVKDVEKYEVEQTINWFQARWINTLLLVHGKKYLAAYNIISNILPLKSFSNLPIEHSEKWIILNAYINYLIAINKFPTQAKKRFNIGKFLNEVPLNSKDKMGSNIPILIIQILFLVHRREYEKVEKLLASLYQYQLRYFDGTMNLRSQYFIKALQYLPKSNYQSEPLNRIANKFITQLENTSMTESQQFFSVEIIPYEHLWDMLLESLESS